MTSRKKPDPSLTEAPPTDGTDPDAPSVREDVFGVPMAEEDRPKGNIHLDDTEYKYTIEQVATYCGVHRVTLMRMEQRGVVPLAKWRRIPNPHRVYTERGREDVFVIVRDYFNRRVPRGVQFV